LKCNKTAFAKRVNLRVRRQGGSVLIDHVYATIKRRVFYSLLKAVKLSRHRNECSQEELQLVGVGTVKTRLATTGNGRVTRELIE